MNIWDILFVPRCVCCDEILRLNGDNLVFCEICHSKWKLSKICCREYNRGQPVRIFDKEAAESERGGYVLYLTEYIPSSKDAPENGLIMSLKNHASHNTVDFVASELAALAERELPLICKGGSCHEDAVIAWIPRRGSSVFKYGFDHMSRVARALSKKTGVPWQRLIKRSFAGAEQKSLTGKQRRINADRSLHMMKGADVSGKTVLLIDDIVTSGASLSAASGLLLDGGAEQVIAVTIASTAARAYDDFNIIKNTED